MRTSRTSWSGFRRSRPAASANCFRIASMKNIEALVDHGGEITLGKLPPFDCVATAADGSSRRAMRRSSAPMWACSCAMRRTCPCTLPQGISGATSTFLLTS